MNLSPDWVPVLEAAGFETIHWSTVGDPRTSDRAILEWALTNGYIIFTNDLDFGAILAATQAEAPSIIQMRGQDVLPASISSLVINVLRQFESVLEAGALVSVDQASARAGTKTRVTSAFGFSVLEKHQTVLTASFTRIFCLFTHSIGDGSESQDCTKKKSAI